MNEPIKMDQEKVEAIQKMLQKAVDVICKCGSQIFTQGSKVKCVSKSDTGDAEDTYFPIPVLYCVRCHEEKLLG